MDSFFESKNERILQKFIQERQELICALLHQKDLVAHILPVSLDCMNGCLLSRMAYSGNSYGLPILKVEQYVLTIILNDRDPYEENYPTITTPSFYTKLLSRDGEQLVSYGLYRDGNTQHDLFSFNFEPSGQMGETCEAVVNNIRWLIRRANQRTQKPKRTPQPKAVQPAEKTHGFVFNPNDFPSL
jgi:hypothetical protein